MYKDDKGAASELVGIHRIIKSYILGEKLVDTEYQNAIIKTLMVSATNYASFPTATSVTFVYERTAPSSPLRRLLVDFYAWIAHEDWIVDVIANGCHEFRRDLLLALVEVRGRFADEEDSKPWVKDPDAYNIVASEGVNKDTSRNSDVSKA